MSLGFKGKLSKKFDYVQVNISKIDLVYLVNPSAESNEVIKMDSLKKRRKRLVIFIIIIILSLCSIILFGNFCSEDICALSSISSLSRKKLFSEHHINRHSNNNNISNNSSSLNNKYSHSHLLSYDDVLNDDFQNKFDINSNDVMVCKRFYSYNIFFIVNVPCHECLIHQNVFSLPFFRFFCIYKR
jgi:hypothetical protein